MDAPAAPSRFARAAALFVAIGLVLYALLYAAAEQVALSHGHSNPFYKMTRSERTADDWLILGASHAMALDFDGFGRKMEQETGLAITNLAAQGTGPLYQRFVLEQYLASHRAVNVMYVVDSFAFHSREWNEDRFADAKLLAATPFSRELAARFARYVADEGVDWRAWVAYTSGFPKVNNRDRFRTDAWEGESQFDRKWTASGFAVDKRIKYLYPHGTPADQLDRYLVQLGTLVGAARRTGARVVLVKLPVPEAYARKLPDEEAFDGAMVQFASRSGAQYLDFSNALPEAKWYFDSDHLNRAGAGKFFVTQLRGVLLAPFRASLPDGR